MTASSSSVLKSLLLTAGLVLAMPALAQNASPPPTTSASAAPADQAGSSAVPGGPMAPVLAVTGVEVMRSALPGGMDVVRVRGVVTSADGVLDFVFVAAAPLSGVQPGPFMPVEALLPIANNHPYKGIRVRGATNVVALKSLPGVIEQAAPKADCAQCIGKVFAFKGAANPPADAVREESLPWKLRVIKVNEGVASFDVDPNRLSLLLGDDNKIVAALWE
jgi:hypothetical protein